MRRSLTALLVSMIVSSSLFAADDQPIQKPVSPEKQKEVMTPEENFDVSHNEEYDENQYAIRGNFLGLAFAGTYILDLDYKISEQMTVGLTGGFYGPSLLTFIGSKVLKEVFAADNIEVDLGVSGYQIGIQGAYYLTGSALDSGLILNPFVNYGTFTVGVEVKDSSDSANTGDIDVTVKGVNTGLRGVYQIVADSGFLFQVGMNVAYRATGDIELGGSLWNEATQSSTFASSSTRKDFDDAIDDYSDSRFSYGFEASVGFVF